MSAATMLTVSLTQLVVDVALSSPANGDVLTYETSSGFWKNKPVPTSPPGGSSGQLQVNDGAGGFGGAASSAVAGSGNLLTLTAGADADVPLTLKAHSAGQTGDMALLYNSYTDVSNYERLRMLWTGNIFYMVSDAAGSGTFRDMIVGTQGGGATLTLRTSGQNRWIVDGSGNLTAGGAFLYDIGDSINAHSPSSIYASTLIRSLGQILAAPQDPATIPMIARGAASQSAPLLQLQDSNSNVWGEFGPANTTANTSFDGLSLINPTPATSGNQRFSPRLRLTGQGWKTTSVAGSQPVDWIIENQPEQGATSPSSNLVFASQINGSGYNPVMTLSSGGNLATITAVADADVPLTLKAHSAGQSGNLLQFLSSSGGMLLNTTSAGRISYVDAGSSEFAAHNAALNISCAAGIAAVQINATTPNRTYYFGAGQVSGAGSWFWQASDQGSDGVKVLIHSDCPDHSYLIDAAGHVGFGLGPSTFSVPTQVQINTSGSSVGGLAIQGAASQSAPLLQLQDSASNVWGEFGPANTAANTSFDGLSLVNPLPATSGNQRYSPRLRLAGQGWKTTSVAGSQQVDFIAEVQTVQGTTNPSGNFVISSQINGGGYFARLALSSDGGLNVLGSDGTTAVFGVRSDGQAFLTAGNALYFGGNGTTPYLQGGGNTLQLSGGSEFLMQGVLVNNVTASPAYVLNSTGSNYSFLQNDGADLWSIAAGGAFGALGTPIIQWGKPGSGNATLGFYGVSPVARQLLATGAGATVDDVITALQTVGLLRQS